jgi:methylenetetrahydrofolate dehydrogenase (NADP+)/methenyltetrahydrofolate cyclohydrolase
VSFVRFSCAASLKNIEEITVQADIIITALGVPNYLKANMVKGVVVIDVGITRSR